MNPLDDRARRSAAALHDKVSEADLKLLAAGLPAGAARTRPVLLSRVLAFAGAFAVVMMAVGLAVVQMNMFATENGPVATEPPAPTVTEPPPVSTSLDDAVPTTSPAPTETTLPEETEATQSDTTPPPIEITSPVPGEVVPEPVVTFTGMTEPGATVTRGKFVADVNAEGRWAIVLVVSEGTTNVTFTATDEAGNEAHATVEVVYEAAGEEKPPPVEFTAFSRYGECSETPPYDEYYGTAAPGAKITITSEYGSGSTQANAEGEWLKKVVFPEAPQDKPFLVTVKDDLGNKKTFEFVSHAG